MQIKELEIGLAVMTFIRTNLFKIWVAIVVASLY